MRPKIVVEISMLIHRKDLYCMWFSVPMFHVGRILTKILRSFFIGKHCVSTFDACQFWNIWIMNTTWYNIIVIVSNPIFTSAGQGKSISYHATSLGLLQCHITQWQSSCIEFFSSSLFMCILRVGALLYEKLTFFIFHIFACACAFL